MNLHDNHNEPRNPASSTIRRRPEEFENGGFTLKTFILRRRNLKTQQSSVILDLCLKKIQSGKSHDYRNTFSKSSVFKMFSVHT